MRRVFLQAYCRYPHGSAVANYAQNLIKAFVNAEYEVILITDIDNGKDGVSSYDNLHKAVIIVPIIPSLDKEIWNKQRKEGYCTERLHVLKEYHINEDDRVIVLGLFNEYFLNKLFELEQKVGFKTLCCVLELYGREDFVSKEQYEKVMHIKGEVYLKADAIISISDYINEYYISKGMSVYKFPPMIDSDKCKTRLQKKDKYSFIIPSKKDSLLAMLNAFANLEEEVLNIIEIHLCGMTEESIQEIRNLSFWKRIEVCTIIHKWLNYKELIELYQQMHFLVIARKKCQRTLANFPSKVPETMNYGVVPIVSDVGDYTKYYLRNEYDSIFIDGDSVTEIEKSIRKAISMNIPKYVKYSENARRTAKECFDYHVWKFQIQEMMCLGSI